MAVISNLSVSLTANMRGLDKGLKKAKRKLKDFSKSVFSVKGALVSALGIGGLGAIISGGISAFREQEQAIASLDAANSSMGRSTVNLSSDLQRLASELQREGIIGDEAIIQGQSFLSTFSQIPDEMLPRATRAMVDLMAKTGRTGAAAANMIGKAAMGQSGALKIAGITLSDSTLKAIKLESEMKKMAEESGINLRGLTDNGKTFALILSDIESQIGGANRALAATDTGAFDQLSNSVGDLKEKVGEAFTKALSKWVRQLSRDIDNADISVQGLADSFQQWIYQSLLDIAPFVQAFKGIQLVLLSLKIGFVGFGALVTGTLRNIARVARDFGDVFGLDIASNAFDALDKSYDQQLDNIRNLKKEASELVGEISNRSFEKELRSKLSDFDTRATITKNKLSAPAKTTATPIATGKIEKLIISPGSTDIRAMNIPQLNRTNDLLGRMLNNRQGATAQ